MQHLLLKRLDEIEILQQNPNTDEEVVDLMESIVSTSDGLRILIERYSHSSNPIMVRSLSFFLAKAASSPKYIIYSLIFTFIDRLRVKNDESTLINCLTAIQRQLISRLLWEKSLQSSSILFPFLMHCLKQSILVQRGVIAVLSCLYRMDPLMEVFDPDQIVLLRTSLEQLSSLHNEMIDSEMEGLSRFLKQK
jgi:hypothetical protein